MYKNIFKCKRKITDCTVVMFHMSSFQTLFGQKKRREICEQIQKNIRANGHTCDALFLDSFSTLLKAFFVTSTVIVLFLFGTVKLGYNELGC